jgi:YHS domain-containing protein
MKRNVRFLRPVLALGVALAALAFLPGGLADTKADAKAEKAKPYTLKTCIVSGSKLDSMGKPYVFTYKGQEFKLCCGGCKADFDKDPAKFVKKLAEAEKKAKDAQK